MTSLRLFLSLWVLALSAHTAAAASAELGHAQPKEKLPVSVFSRDSAIRHAQISPDGSYLAVIFRDDGEEKLAVLRTQTKEIVSSFFVKGRNRSVGDVTWVSNERLVYGTRESTPWDNTPYDLGELIGVNVDASKHKFLLGYQSGNSWSGSHLRQKKNDYGNHAIIHTLPDDDEHILIAFYPWRVKNRMWVTDQDALPIVYRLNVLTAKKKQVGKLPMPLARAVADTRGQVRFSIALDENNETVIHYRNRADEEWLLFALSNFEGTDLVPIGFNDGDDGVYFTAYVNEGTRAVYRLSFENRGIEKIFHNEAVDPSGLIFDDEGRRLVGVKTSQGLPEYHYLDDRSPIVALHRALDLVFENSDVVITSSTRDRERSLVRIYSDKNPGDYFLYSQQSKSLDFLFSYKEGIPVEAMATTRAMTFAARDGLALHGYLTLPQNQSENLALVVLPHGGPHHVRDSWGFDSRVQMLAHYGYAVLQLNFRGSGGFGQSFAEAGEGNWGASMQDDLTDATLALIEQGIADPEKICIYGSSYGGYAALMGVVREPQLYQCAIGSMGVYDLPMMFEKGDIPESSGGIAYLKKTLGTDVELQKQRSPAFNAEKIKANVLLIHGKADRRVPISQAKAMKSALDRVGKDYQWLQIDAGGHGYFDDENREIVYRQVLQFLEQNIGASRKAPVHEYSSAEN